MRWSSLNTRPELAEAARRLRQLSCSRRAEIGMHGSQAVRSLLIGFSRARAARVVQRAHLVSPIAEFDCDGLARSLTPRDRGIAVGSSQPACSSPAATQRPQHRRSPTRNTSGPCPGLPLATATVQQAPQPASATCLVRLLRSAATPSRPPVPGPLAS